ncbi:MAG: hypothetical protein HY725_20710 [Candidatus Rokubacteria bacterium]|nr:hypothetical protein [Candidatus Rokubacteria bacterium]
MSYELIAILLSGIVQVLALAFIARQVRESIRVGRAVAGLVAQESGKIQDLLRQAAH